MRYDLIPFKSSDCFLFLCGLYGLHVLYLDKNRRKLVDLSRKGFFFFFIEYVGMDLLS